MTKSEGTLEAESGTGFSRPSAIDDPARWRLTVYSSDWRVSRILCVVSIICAYITNSMSLLMFNFNVYAPATKAIFQLTQTQRESP